MSTELVTMPMHVRVLMLLGAVTLRSCCAQATLLDEQASQIVQQQFAKVAMPDLYLHYSSVAKTLKHDKTPYEPDLYQEWFIAVRGGALAGRRNLLNQEKATIEVSIWTADRKFMAKRGHGVFGAILDYRDTNQTILDHRDPV